MVSIVPYYSNNQSQLYHISTKNDHSTLILGGTSLPVKAIFLLFAFEAGKSIHLQPEIKMIKIKINCFKFIYDLMFKILQKQNTGT